MRGKLAISNIAWPAEADQEALTLARDLGFGGIELAPSKVFGPLDQAKNETVVAYREALAGQGLRVPALQAILFGVSGAHLFNGEAERAELAVRLTRVAEVAGLLGARACVFGSPPLRDPGDLAAAEAFEQAATFFAAIAPRFADHGTVLAFEANPPIYNCRFVMRTLEAVELVREVATPGFGLQIDMGTVFTNNEPDEAIAAAVPLAAHCHASEPELVPLGSGGHDHARPAAALARAGYERWVSAEMKATTDWQAAMRGAARILQEHYGALAQRSEESGR
jgi:D-psicose/D-tagatose/L-ribulose 3-epimerase